LAGSDDGDEDEEGGAAAVAPKRKSKAAELGGMEYTSWGWLGVGQGKYPPLTKAAGLRTFKLSTPAPLRGYTRANVTQKMLQGLANPTGRKPTGGWPTVAAAKTDAILDVVCKRRIRGPRSAARGHAAAHAAGYGPAAGGPHR
jgi:hypothetical protein